MHYRFGETEVICGRFFGFACLFLRIAENLTQALLPLQGGGERSSVPRKSCPPFSMSSTYLRLKFVVQKNLMKNCLSIRKITRVFGEILEWFQYKI